MIKTVLNVDDICQDCPYFSTETNHATNCDGIHIIYISCDPETLARDLEEFSSMYEVKYVQPVDMFPMTAHVESVVLLEKKTQKLG